MSTTVSKKSIEIAMNKGKIQTQDTNKIIKLTYAYIDKLNEVDKVRIIKNKLVNKIQYEKASIERSKELNLLLEADSIFKKMKALRKKINKDSNLLKR